MKRLFWVILAISLSYGATEAKHQRRDGRFGLFYGSLAAHGEWIEISFGSAWRPYNTGHQWRPYMRGRWIWTDNGWYWNSYEPFGWQPITRPLVTRLLWMDRCPTMSGSGLVEWRSRRLHRLVSVAAARLFNMSVGSRPPLGRAGALLELRAVRKFLISARRELCPVSGHTGASSADAQRRAFAAWTSDRQ